MTAALDAGADMVGLVFFTPSPRNVSLASAQALAGLARGRAAVGLAVSPDGRWLYATSESAAPAQQPVDIRASPARSGWSWYWPSWASTGRWSPRSSGYFSSSLARPSHWRRSWPTYSGFPS